MSENEVEKSYKLAIVVDGKVEYTLICNESIWALYTSNPIFVDITDNPNSLVLGQSYSVPE